MKVIGTDFVLTSDKKLILEGVLLFRRPFYVALEWAKENNLPVNLLDPDFFELIVAPVQKIYNSLYPNGNFSFPPILSGGVAIRDNIYSVRVPLLYGERSITPLDFIDIDKSELEIIFTYYKEEGWQALYSVCDLVDFGYGASDLISTNSPATGFLERTIEQIAAFSNISSNHIPIEAFVQTALLSAELAFKATFIHLGDSEEYCRKKFSHRHVDMALYLAQKIPEQSDDEILKICKNFPDYVYSRYNSTGLNRLELIKVAMGAQFVAAECIRRITDRNIMKSIQAQAQFPRVYDF